MAGSRQRRPRRPTRTTSTRSCSGPVTCAGWTGSSAPHTWADPVTSQPVVDAIFSRLRPTRRHAGPQRRRLRAHARPSARTCSAGRPATTPTTGPACRPRKPTITPDGLDRAALEACVGRRILPGHRGRRAKRGRPPDHRGAELRRGVPARPRGACARNHERRRWRCRGRPTSRPAATNWWPVPRPNEVHRPGHRQLSASGTRDVTSYAGHGRQVAQAGLRGAAGRTSTSRWSAATRRRSRCSRPISDFIDVPQGPMGMVRETALAILRGDLAGLRSPSNTRPAARPRIRSWSPVNATRHGRANRRPMASRPRGSGSSTAPASAAVVDPARRSSRSARRPAARPGRSPSTPTPSPARPRPVALVLDRSGSMSDDRGDGQSKHVSLQQAAEIFVDVMLEGDGVGLVRYNEDAQACSRSHARAPAASPTLNRSATNDLINGNGFDPAGATSIGDGIFEGRGTSSTRPRQLRRQGAGRAHRRHREPARAGSRTWPAQINERTYAVGLGTAAEHQRCRAAEHLRQQRRLPADHRRDRRQNRFLLQKYFLQILAGVSNAEVVLDPDGELHPGQVQRIPFQLTDADAGVDVILLSPFVRALDFRLQTPSGLHPRAVARHERARDALGARPRRGLLPPGAAHPVAARCDSTRPAPGTRCSRSAGRAPNRRRTTGTTRTCRSCAGRVGPRSPVPPRRPFELERAFAVSAARAGRPRPEPAAAEPGRRPGLPYSLVVHTYSSVSLRADVDQDSREPGATVDLRATLTQSALPVEGDPFVWAEVTRPGGSSVTVTLAADHPGEFSGSFPADRPGVYAIRVRARGRTRVGRPFTREQTVTAAVWRGGDVVVDPGSGGPATPVTVATGTTASARCCGACSATASSTSVSRSICKASASTSTSPGSA